MHITNGLSEGGVETLLYSFSKELIKKGHTVSILVISRDELGLKEKFEKMGVSIISGKYKNIYNILNVILIYKHLKRFDIVHIHLFPNQLYAAIASYFIRGKLPQIVTTEHNTWNNRRKYGLLRYLDRWMYGRYNYIVGISEDTSIELKKWLRNDCVCGKIITINNGVERCDGGVLNASDFGCSTEDFIIVMVARFSAQKDQETLIKALSLLPSNVHAIFVGTGSTLAYNKEIVRTLKLENRVFFAGFQKDVFAILKMAHLGVLCSNWEGFGLAVVEYMLAGLPILASNVVGVRDVVGIEELLYSPKNFEELASKIRHLMCDSTYCDKIKQYCLSRGEQFSVSKMTDSYISLYKKIISI